MQNRSECSKHTIENCTGIVLGLNSLPSCSELLFDHGVVSVDGRLIMCCKTERGITRISLSSWASKREFLLWFNVCVCVCVCACVRVCVCV